MHAHSEGRWQSSERRREGAPLLALGQEVVEDAYKVQAGACDTGGEEDGCQAVRVHVARTGQHIVPAPHLPNQRHFSTYIATLTGVLLTAMADSHTHGHLSSHTGGEIASAEHDPQEKRCR